MAANSFVTLPPTSGTSAGASVDTSALASFKTVSVGGSFQGIVILEGSADDVAWVPLAQCSVSCIIPLRASLPFMRMRTVGVSGLPAVRVGALTATNFALALPLPAAVGGVYDGAGAAQVASALEPLLTLLVAGGSFVGSLTIEGSQDAVSWGALASFGNRGIAVRAVTPAFLRVRASNMTPRDGATIVAFVVAPADLAPGLPMTFDDFICQSYQLT